VLPHMGPEQLVEVMLETDVLINASQWPENSPLTISDALQLGVGVVAPAIGGITELLEGREDGFTFLTGSSAALEGALMEAVTWARGRARPSEFMGSATERVLRDARSYRTLLESVSTN
jgi:glycosyltransferase involved in cell wall biosynthesis